VCDCEKTNEKLCLRDSVTYHGRKKRQTKVRTFSLFERLLPCQCRRCLLRCLGRLAAIIGRGLVVVCAAAGVHIRGLCRGSRGLRGERTARIKRGRRVDERRRLDDQLFEEWETACRARKWNRVVRRDD
jgi:hypothetical protein